MLGNRWTQKPPIGTRIDRSDPLTQGLVWFAPFWEGGGSTVADVVGNVNLTFEGTAAWSPAISPRNGGGMLCAHQSDGALGSWPQNLQLQYPFSTICGFRWNGITPDAGSNILSMSTFSNGSGQDVAKLRWYAGSNVLGVVGGTSPDNTGISVPAKVDVVVVSVFGKSSQQVYVFTPTGRSVYNGTTTGATLSWPTPWAEIYVGQVRNAQLLCPQITYSFGGVYTRTLSEAEAGALGSNPWRVFQPKRLQTAAIYAVSNTGYQVTGPAGTTVNTVSSNFTVSPTVLVTDNVTISSSVSGDTVTPSSLTFASSLAPQTFTVTPHALGQRTITLTSSHGFPAVGSPLTLNASVPFTMTGPPIVYQGVPAVLSLTPSALATDTVTFSDGAAGGTFVPASLAWNNSRAVQTVTYTAPRPGALVLTATSAQSAVITGTPLTVTSYAVAVDAYVTKSGKLAIFGTNSSSLVQNGNAVPASVTAVNSNPTVQVNGRTVQIGPPTWVNNTLDCPFVSYLLQCGGVQSIAMSSAGTSSYTAPTVTWNGDGGGSGLTLGTPVLAKGVVSYAITSAGSGYTSSFAITVPGGSFKQAAVAWVTVVNGTVTSVVPITGSALAYGIGYTGTTFSATLAGSAAIGFNGNNSEWQSAPTAGSGLTVTCTVGNYIQTVPITNGGSGFTSPPTFTITDTTGTGAVATSVMTGPVSTDFLTYSASAGWLTTTVQSTTGLTTAPATSAPMTNWVGQTEGPTGRMLGFTAKPTMNVGANLGYAPTAFACNAYFTGKNKLKASMPWQSNATWNFGPGPNQLALDSTYYPQYWTPNTWISATFYSYAGWGLPNTLPEYQGTWALQYDDDYYAGTASSPAYVTVDTAGSTQVTSNLIAGAYTTMPVAGAVTLRNGSITAIAVANGGSGITGAVVTITGGSYAAAVAVVSGGQVTGINIVCGGTGYTGASTVTITPVNVVGSAVTVTYNVQFTSMNTGGNLVLNLNMVSAADGKCHVRNPWVFAPGNTIDRGQPYATDDNVVANLTANGKGVSIMRFMSSLGGPWSPNIIDPSDIASPNNFSWSNYWNWNTNLPAGPPNCGSFSGTLTAGSTSVTGIADTSTLAVGLPIVGTGVPGIVYSFNPYVNSETTITAINDAHSLTLSAPAMISGVQSLSVNPMPSGTIVFQYARFYNTNPASTTYAWSSPRIYSSENWAISGQDSFGKYLDITQGPYGANDNGLFIAGPPSAWSTSPMQNSGVLELRSTLPHGLKTGACFSYVTPSQTCGGTTTSGSATITGITGNPTLAVNQTVSGAGIPSGAYITTVNSPTSITISTSAIATGTVALTLVSTVPWSFSGSRSIGGSDSFVQGQIYVTGPYTVAIYLGLAYGLTGTLPQSITSTTEVPVYVRFGMSAPSNSIPYEYAAAMVGSFPGCVMHLNVPFACSDAAITSIAQRVGANIGPTNPVFIEMGNEHWGAAATSNEIPWEMQMANLTRYMPVGTVLYPHYTPTRAVASYTTTGAAISSQDACYALRAANKHYVFCQAWSAMGLDPTRVKLIYGSWWGSDPTAQNLANAAKTLNLPQDYIAVAPYSGSRGDSTIIVANRPVGYAGGANGGNWPVDAINDLTRHCQFYGLTQRATWKNLKADVAGTTLKLMCYEAAMQNLAWNLPFFDQIQQDLFYHPSFYDVVWAYLLQIQYGDPNTSASGSTYLDYFELYSNSAVGNLWKLADGCGQPMGPGTTNQYTTPQGGAPGTGNIFGYYQTNQAVGLQALHDWIGQHGLAKSTPPNARWFAGLNPGSETGPGE